MKQWFDHLPIHRKLVVTTLLVTGTALLAVTAGVILLDVWRYRGAAAADIRSVAEVIADNSQAAAAFEDPNEAQTTVNSAALRPVVTRVCLYLASGRLFAQYERSAAYPCTSGIPDERHWYTIGDTAEVRRSGRLVGHVYAERDYSDLGDSIAMTALAGLVMLLLAALLAYAVAQRVQRTVSAPIVELADAARTIGEERRFEVPGIHAAPDEVGALVRAFTGMVDRVRDASEELQRSNEALRQEVDERRRVEREREALLLREREASRLKDEFLAAVSHELRTPLNAILGWVQILASTSPSAETTRKAIASIVRNAHAQTRVIEDLIDVSRIATGKLTLRVQDLDLRRPVEAAVDVVRTAAEAKHIALSVSVPPTPPLVRGDPDRLQQVVWNLLSNAVKFTPPGGRVEVALEEAGNDVRIRVGDTGIGIPAHFLPHVFDRFRQADGSLTREHGGLGLGLAIVKELTELHGGSVAVTSDGAGHGATFMVTLPRAAVRGPGDARIAAAAPRQADLAGVRVLAVDDNPDALDIVSLALTAAGASVHRATRGVDAIRQWEHGPMDVLICDLAMPDMSGFDVLVAIRQRDAARGQATRAIALSAHASQAHLDESRAAGFERHIAKPFDTEVLVRAVAEAVGR
jgi:signal transduction histidine kinase/ActR/RegA family two-component response regulator